jgi:DNA-binding beta-propeller fold protein YncE
MALALRSVLLVLGCVAATALCAAQDRPSTPIRGMEGDLWADVIIGQPDFNEVIPGQAGPHMVFNPGGVIVDRSVRPNRIYVYDGGDSRVLGFSRIGYCKEGPDQGEPGTCDSDFPGYGIVMVEGIGADLVIGQPGFDRTSANQHGNFDTYPVNPPAGPAALATMPIDQISLTEGGSFANMAVDGKGNLYVPDWCNHRVLLYRSPFETDCIADEVWGQPDFMANEPNHGLGYGKPDASGLALRSPGNLGFVGGVGLDDNGNLWIADNENNRVLRFPFDPATGLAAKTADLVLGQPDFDSCARGKGMNQMSAPCAVRVAGDGTVYVADSLNDRVLAYHRPLTNGMEASGTLGSDLRFPTSLEIDPESGGIWVLESFNSQLQLFVDGRVKKVLLTDLPRQTREEGPIRGDHDRWNNAWFMTEPRGQIGIDSDGNIYVPCSTNVQDIWRFPAPIPDPEKGVAHSADYRLFKRDPSDRWSVESELQSARGVAVVNEQLIVADAYAVVFWNDVDFLTNGCRASGVVGAESVRRPTLGDPYGRIREDKAGHLYAVRGGEVEVYALPLHNAEMPLLRIKAPLQVAGGGQFSWTGGLNIGGIAASPDGSALWLSDPNIHTVFRVRDPLTNPVVDIVLGHPDLEERRPNNGRQPGPDTLNCPGAVALDAKGNLFVSDHSLEVSGNHRLLEFDASLFPARPGKAVFGIPATRVWGHGGCFTGTDDPRQNLMLFEPAFDSQGRMVVGANGYSGMRFPLVYGDPFENAQPIATLGDFHSMPYAATFDDQDNLYITDLNRARVLIYKRPFAG